VNAACDLNEGIAKVRIFCHIDMLTMIQSIRESGEEEMTVRFSSLARDYYDPVYRFIRRQAPSPQEAADITQDTFVRAQKSFPKFDPSRGFAPWIFTIARRQIADYYRQRQRQHEPLEIEVEDSSPNPHERAASEEQADQLWKLASGLKPKLHQVLLLHYQEEFPIHEIAEIMGLTRTHVKVLLFRARSALKTRLSTANAEGGASL
jgi:RNA polymerase sigma-70 factor (ECF subfamily)